MCRGCQLTLCNTRMLVQTFWGIEHPNFNSATLSTIAAACYTPQTSPTRRYDSHHICGRLPKLHLPPVLIFTLLPFLTPNP